MLRRFAIVLGLAAIALTTPQFVVAQTTISARSATLRIGGRLHAQYQTSSIDASNDDFFIRRARVNIDMAFNDFFSGKVLTDFASGRATLLDAYVTLDFSDEFRFSAGQLKRAFDLFELVSSTDLSLIERTGKIGGYDSCTGVGSVCSYSRLTEELDFAGRDAGIRVDGSTGAISYQATMTNGTGVGTPDANDGKSLSGRVSVAASEDLTVSFNVGRRDYLDPAPGNETAGAVAWGGDAQLGTWRDGLLVQAGVVGGDNWQALDIQDDPEQFLALQVAASFYHPVDGDRIVGIEPLARLSVGDPNRSLDDDSGTLITPGVMFYLMGKNKIGVNLDYYSPQTGDSEWSLRFGTFLYF